MLAPNLAHVESLPKPMEGRSKINRRSLKRPTEEKVDKATRSFKQRALLGDVLYAQYESNSDLCDVTLIIHGKEQKAHWSVLMTSPYFEALYNSGLAERQSGRIRLNLGDKDSIEAILKYLYTGTVVITMENVEQLLQTADYFLLSNFKQSCECFFTTRGELCPANSISLCLLAGKYDLPNLYSRTYNYILQNFEVIAEDQLHHPLSADTMQMFLQSKSLDRVAPKKMFRYIISWTEHDLPNRKKYFKDLFCCLELHKFTKDFFERQVEKCPLVLEEPTCQNHIMQFYAKVEVGILRFKPEKSLSKEIFHFINDHKECLCSAHDVSFIIDRNRWEFVKSLNFRFLVEQPIMAVLSDQTIVVTDKKKSFDLCHEPLSENKRLARLQTFYLYTQDEEESAPSWKVRDILCPSPHFHVEHLVSCGGNVYAVCRLDLFKSRLEWKLYQVVLHNPRRRGPRYKFLHKSKLFTSAISTAAPGNTAVFAMRSCVLHDRYMCIMVGKHDRRKSPDACFAVVDAQKFQKCPMYSTQSAVYYPILFAIGDEVVMVRLTSRDAVSFNYKTKRFTECPQFTVNRLLPLSLNRHDYMYKFHFNKLYVFGGYLGARRLISCFCYSYADSTWERLHDIPATVTLEPMLLRIAPHSDLSMRALQQLWIGLPMF